MSRFKRRQIGRARSQLKIKHFESHEGERNLLREEKSGCVCERRVNLFVNVPLSHAVKNAKQPMRIK